MHSYEAQVERNPMTKNYLWGLHGFYPANINQEVAIDEINTINPFRGFALI